MVNGSFGVECEAEGFTFQQTGARNEDLPNGQGLQTGFELTPIRTGSSEITINGIMLVNTGGLGGFATQGRDRPFTFRRRVTVEHVPETGRPAEWTGAIGRFLAESVSVSNTKPEVGEPIRLRAILAGEGNLDRILPPELASNETWDVVPGMTAASAAPKTSDPSPTHSYRASRASTSRRRSASPSSTQRRVPFSVWNSPPKR